MEGEVEIVDITKDLTGFLRIKRKRMWVRRFIVIKSGIIYYYKSSTSTEPRFILHLSGCMISKEARELIIDISKQTVSMLKIQLTKISDLNLWYQYLLKSSQSNGSMVINQECQYDIMLKASLKENDQLIDSVPKSPLTDDMIKNIKEITEQNYRIISLKGSSLYACTYQDKKNSPIESDFYLKIAMIFVVIEILRRISEDLLLLLGILYISYQYLLKSSYIRKEEIPLKQYFKCTTMIRASAGEILVALHDNYTRPIWEPYLQDCNESLSYLHLTYQYDSKVFTQDISRKIASENSYYYVIEKNSDNTIKNLFKIEQKRKKNEIQSLVTIFGSINSSVPPLSSNPELLSCFKLYVESSTIYLSNTEVNQALIESEDEEAENSQSSPEDSNFAFYNNETLRLLKESEALINDTNGWEDIKIKSRFVTASRRKAAGGLYIIKAEGEILRTPMEIVDCLKDLSRKHEYDPMFEHGHLVQLITPEMGIAYQKFKSIGPISARDFCLLQRMFTLGDGKIAAVAASVEHPECPETKCVRAQLHLACHYITPSGPNTSKLTYLIYLDVRGSIPKFVINSVQGDQALFVENLRNFLN